MAQFPELGVLGHVAGQHRLVLDGEIVAVGGDGRPDFGLLQHRRGAPSRFALAKAPVQYFVFDLLFLNGRSLLDKPYVVRRQLLVDLALPGVDPAVQVPPAFFGNEPADLLRVAGEYQIEGILQTGVAVDHL